MDANLQGKKRSIVLIIDDEPVVRQLLERQLSAMGFENRRGLFRRRRP